MDGTPRHRFTPPTTAVAPDRDESPQHLAERPSSTVPALGSSAVLLVVLAVVAWAVTGGIGRGGLNTGEAVLLGLIEGVTEWLPISSTGHLTVAQDLLGIHGRAADSYAIVIQAGAILAVLGLYRERFTAMLRGASGRDPVGRRTLVAVLVACLPAATVGLLLEDTIKERLFGPWPVVAAWCGGGIAILVAARSLQDRAQGSGAPLAALGWRSAALIGAAQTLALWPGVSRSLVTILAATAVGLSVPAAVEFSFLLGFVTLGGATAYELASSGDEILTAYGVAVPLLGVAVAFVAAVVGMRWMVGYLDNHSLAIFGWYRLAAAGVVTILLLTHVI